MTPWGLLITVTIGAFSLVACGGDNTGDVQTATVAAADSSAEETPTSAPKTGEAILIETHADATNHTSEVLAVSFIGESAFCPGGTGIGGSEGATITSTFHCPGGELTVEFRTDATQPRPGRGVADRERHRHVQRHARRRLDGRQVRRP